jgi:predicted MPP superfamily phosphohydrolase
VQSLKPDLIAVTGDLVDGPREALKASVAPLAGLKAPLGVHYVTGNHEYFWDVDRWLEEFAGLGFELLLNEHRLKVHKNAKVLVLGVNDPTALRIDRSDGPDLAKARAGAPAADFTLFLAHQPLAYPMAEAADADLFLAGHTHGGQFYPFPPIVSLFHRYFRGLYRHSGKMQVYVHTGSGFWGPPNRLGVPPEVALLVLERAG